MQSEGGVLANEQTGGSVWTVLRVNIVDLRIEVRSNQDLSGNVGAFGIPALDDIVTSKHARSVEGEPFTLAWSHP